MLGQILLRSFDRFQVLVLAADDHIYTVKSCLQFELLFMLVEACLDLIEFSCGLLCIHLPLPGGVVFLVPDLFSQDLVKIPVAFSVLTGTGGWSQSKIHRTKLIAASFVLILLGVDQFGRR